MADNSSEGLPYSLADLPPGPLGDMAESLSPFERAAIRTRRAVLNRQDTGRFDMSPAALASMGIGLAPGSGVTDVLGWLPDLENGGCHRLFANLRRRDIGSAGWQMLGALGDGLYLVPAVGVPFGVAAKAPRAAQRIGQFAKYAEQYPPVSAPRLIDKATKKEIQFASQAEADALVGEGKAYWSKNLPPETKEFARARRAIQRDMDQHGYTPYLDPAKRADVDPENYPTNLNMSVDAMPARHETKQKYVDMYQTEDAANRLRAAYKVGEEIGDNFPNARDIFFMKQLEDKYVEKLGPVVGRERFKTEYADSMAATTAGNNPADNYLMAHYVNYLNKRGLGMPNRPGNALSNPRALRGAKRGPAQKLFDNPTVGFGAKNPKRHDFSYSIAGHTDKPPWILRYRAQSFLGCEPPDIMGRRRSC